MIRTILTSTAKSARRHRVVAALLGVLIAFGGAAVVRAATAPSFSVSAQPPNQTIQSGASATYVISINPSNGFGSAVTLTAGALPKGTSATWTVGSTTTSGATVVVPAGTTTRTATLTIGGGQPTAGTYNPTVTGTSGSLSSSTTLTFVVVSQNAANFTLSVSPSAQTVAQGTITSTVTITRSNWKGSVALSTSNLPPNATATFSPSATTANTATLTITTNASTPAGTYAVNVVGTAVLSGNTTSTRYGAFTLTVLPPFTISGNLASPLLLGIGKQQPLNLSITNPYSTPLTVTNLQVSLTSIQQAAGAKGTCNQTGASSPNFQITNLPTGYSVTIPANSTASLSKLGSGQQPTVTWIDQPNFAQNGCLGATLNFSYSGNGTF